MPTHVRRRAKCALTDNACASFGCRRGVLRVVISVIIIIIIIATVIIIAVVVITLLLISHYYSQSALPVRRTILFLLH